MSNVAKNERRAKALLGRLIADRKLTQEGSQWLTIATDPFHDTEMTPTGYPDMNSCTTITQCFTYTKSIVAPGDGEWDAHVTLMPLSRTQAITGIPGTVGDQPLTQYKFASAGGGISAPQPSPLAGPPLNGGYNVFTYPSGQNPFYSGNGATVAGNDLQFPPMGGQFRMVAAGFEVVNTTPELYKGGSVTCYRTPSQASKQNLVVYNAISPATGTPMIVDGANFFPQTQAQAQLYPASKTWAAADGVYSIATQSSDVNDFTTLCPGTPFFFEAPSQAYVAANTPTLCYTYVHSVGSQQSQANNSLAKILPFDFHGAIFTGLSPQTTLQVTVKYYIERIPTTSESDLLVLSRPPTPYDPTALEIYTRCVQELSVAVPVGENPLGEWFNDVLEIVSEWGPKIGNLVGGPGSLVGNAAGAAAKMALNSRRPNVLSLGPAPPLPPRTSSVTKTDNNKELRKEVAALKKQIAATNAPRKTRARRTRRQKKRS